MVLGRWLVGMTIAPIALALAIMPTARSQAANDPRPVVPLVDSTGLQAGPDGRLRYVEPTLDVPVARLDSRPAARSAATARSLSQTFALHSNPAARRKIFIDFDGGRVTSTIWNDELLGRVTAPAWDPARDGAQFSDGELAAIQEIWERVSEDYAPWDIDVTTEDPGRAGLNRSGRSDLAYGVQMLVTPSTTARATLCGGCAGISYIGVFDFFESAYNIGWVFPQGVGHNVKYVAEAVSHEAGHTFGLSHDGKGLLSGYYKGQGSWAPIMGAAYGKAVTQFSGGFYSGANNKENDLAIIGKSLPLQPDEAGDNVGHAVQLGHGNGIITTRNDRDYYDLGHCPAGVTITARPADVGPNLDIGLTLLDDLGRQVAYDDPPVRSRDEADATGLDAAVVTPDSGRYYVSVDGVGAGDSRDGYDDYASIGRYRVDAGSCEAKKASGDDASIPSTTAIVGPTKARAGTKPDVKVTVRNAAATPSLAPIRGKVRLRVNGSTVRTTRLTDGRARLTLPRIRGSARTLKVVVVYLGSSTIDGSRATSRIRVVRR